jgi:RNA polymerase sigma factor (sigma-70 family)
MEHAIPRAVAPGATTDEELVSRLAAGDMEALGALYVRHKAMVCAALRRFAPTSAPADIDELAQDVFLALPDAASRYEERARFRAWLFGIAVRKAQGFRRRAWIRRLAGRAPDEPRDPKPGPDLEAERRELALHLLERLPPAQREVLVLHAVEGFDGEEIARILDISPGTVWTRLHRARQAVLAAREAAVPFGGAALEVKT